MPLAAANKMIVRIFDVEHGACAIFGSTLSNQIGMIDSGDNATTEWHPSSYIRNTLGYSHINQLFITNADQDHISDLDGLVTSGLTIGTFHRNRTIPGAVLRYMKMQGGLLTADMERYLQLDAQYVGAVTQPVNAALNGIYVSEFANSYPSFADTNNLSVAVFVKFGGFKILFPGDLEEDGWTSLLTRPDFRAELVGTTILVASHHGRENGYCEDIFNHFSPSAVVMSDKSIIHDTQEMVSTYRGKVLAGGVLVGRQNTRRHVLTTRRDGDIWFTVSEDSNFLVNTENTP
jgi:beta-lactamase superfamily II metal-dependent hydrolase